MEMDLNLDSLDILKFKVRLASGEVVTLDAEKELGINDEDINTDFINQPGKYAWWATLAESAKANADEKRTNVERALAEADGRARKAMELNGHKITEGAVEKWTKKDAEYLQAVSEYNKASKNAAILAKIVRAFEHRRESLFSLGSNLRKEFDGNEELRLKQKMAREIVERR